MVGGGGLREAERRSDYGIHQDSGETWGLGLERKVLGLVYFEQLLEMVEAMLCNHSRGKLLDH